MSRVFHEHSSRHVTGNIVHTPCEVHGPNCYKTARKGASGPREVRTCYQCGTTACWACGVMRQTRFSDKKYWTTIFYCNNCWIKHDGHSRNVDRRQASIRVFGIGNRGHKVPPKTFRDIMEEAAALGITLNMRELEDYLL